MHGYRKQARSTRESACRRDHYSDNPRKGIRVPDEATRQAESQRLTKVSACGAENPAVHRLTSPLDRASMPSMEGREGSLRSLIDLYLLRCPVEGKSPRTVRAYRETLSRSERSVGLDELAGIRRRAQLLVPRALHPPQPRDLSPLLPRGALFLQLASRGRSPRAQPLPRHA